MTTQLEEDQFNYETFNFDSIAEYRPIRDDNKKIISYVGGTIQPLINLKNTRVSYGYDYKPDANSSYYVGHKNYENKRKRKHYLENEWIIKCKSCLKPCLIHANCSLCFPNTTYCIDCVQFNHKDLCQHLKNVRSRTL